MQKHEPWQEDRIDVRTLYHNHLAYALDLLHQALGGANAGPASAEALHAERCAMSAIIHGFSSLEAALNFMRCRMFTVSDGPEFIPVADRDYLAQRMVERWDKLAVTEKCNTILSVLRAPLLPNELHSRLSEVNTLRNWLVHGVCYHSRLLVAPSSEEGVPYEVIYEEPGESWKNWDKKFPLCRFNQPLAINLLDAQTALRVVLQVLLSLSKSTGFNWFYTTCKPHLAACGLFGDLECNLDVMLGMKKTEPSP